MRRKLLVVLIVTEIAGFYLSCWHRWGMLFNRYHAPGGYVVRAKLLFSQKLHRLYCAAHCARRSKTAPIAFHFPDPHA